MHVTMLLYPGLTQLDLTGPYEVFARYSELKIDLVWKDLGAVTDGSGLAILPTETFDTAPATDILFVPGGPGQLELMSDLETLAFLRRRADDATFVTSVCTGSLILAAAGLLQGYRATCHWVSLQQLELMGAIPVQERVVFDGNRVTGAGVTAGIDFALSLVAEFFGDDRAQRVQLSMEYDPHPPFKGGSIATAKAAHIEHIKRSHAAFQERRQIAAEAAGAALSQSFQPQTTKIRKAAVADAPDILRLLQSVASWLETDGPGKLWSASSFQLRDIQQKIVRSEVVALHVDGQLAACMYIEESDETFWPQAAPGEALYLHKIAVDRRFAGSERSKLLLDWAADYAQNNAFKFLRLDCAPREQLVGVYTRAGFERVGEDQVLEGLLVARLQRALKPAP